MTNAVEIRGLRKTYGGIEAVAELDLTIGKGELLALLGVNGAGKSTTIKMLSCLTIPSAGDAWILGHSIRTEPDRGVVFRIPFHHAVLIRFTEYTDRASNLPVQERVPDFISGRNHAPAPFCLDGLRDLRGQFGGPGPFPRGVGEDVDVQKLGAAGAVGALGELLLGQVHDKSIGVVGNNLNILLAAQYIERTLCEGLCTCRLHAYKEECKQHEVSFHSLNYNVLRYSETLRSMRASMSPSSARTNFSPVTAS